MERGRREEREREGNRERERIYTCTVHGTRRKGRREREKGGGYMYNVGMERGRKGG